MKQINIHIIRTDGDTQSRVRLDQAVVNEYAEHLKEGAEFPPMVVFHDGSDYWLADGFHRLFAMKANGVSSVEVDVRPGTVEDAQLYSFSANGKRGLSNTDEDNRNIIIRMLTHPKWSLWSNAAIAKHVGVSSMTVGRIKKSVEPADEPASTVVKYNRDGVEKEMDTSNIKRAVKRKTAERPVGTKPDSSTINEDKLEISMLQDRVSELADTITDLSAENDLLRDKIAIGQWDASEIEKIDIEDTIKELRTQVKVLEAENKSMREGRNSYMNRNAELQSLVKSLQAKLKKYEA